MKVHNFLWVLLWPFCTTCLMAQTVGNGSSIMPSAGEQEAYGINMVPSQGTTTFATRHYNRSNNTGIGGSFIGTASPTSESSPALHYSSSALTPISTQQFRLPNLGPSPFQVTSNPALGSFTPALPAIPRSTALVSPTTSTPGSGFSRPGLNSFPSFSKQSSLMDQMQFDRFDSFGKNLMEMR